MTPEEKAKELFEIYTLQGTGNKKFAKNGALAAVDEMIIQNGELYLYGIDYNYYRVKNSYLYKVKEEIEKL